MRLTFQPEWLQVEVEDNGRGFDAANGRGRGLENLQQRCDELGWLLLARG